MLHQPVLVGVNESDAVDVEVAEELSVIVDDEVDDDDPVSVAVAVSEVVLDADEVSVASSSWRRSLVVGPNPAVGLGSVKSATNNRATPRRRHLRGIAGSRLRGGCRESPGKRYKAAWARVL